MHDFINDACLLTDFYQFTMAQAYFDQKRHNTTGVFHLFFRKNPFAGNWALVSGVSDALKFITQFNFDNASLKFLATIKDHKQQRLFSDEFLSFLQKTPMKVDVSGLKDGEVIFPFQPILRIEGPLFLCQLLETPLLNIINFQTLIATKASRIMLAAKGKPVIDFGLRRAQGFDGGISATKAAYVGGIIATSNVWAAKHFGIEPAGTQAHSFIMSYANQQQAFFDFAQSFKDNCILVIDTYEPLLGIKDAIKTFLKLKDQGHRPLGIRIDSGDLLSLSQIARNMLDQAGLPSCKIIASGDLDEHEIRRLEDGHAQIDIYGVGTKLVTAHGDPALGGVYKLAAIRENGLMRDTFKASRTKDSWPGCQAITRFFQNSQACGDLVFDPILGPTTHLPIKKVNCERLLHEPLMSQGQILWLERSLTDIRKRAQQSLESLPKDIYSLDKAEPYPVYFDDAIVNKKKHHYQSATEVDRESIAAH